MLVSSSVVADASVPPELIDGERAQQAVGVVEFVVVGDPGSDKSPGGLDGRVSAETGNLLGLATYSNHKQIKR